MSHEMERWIGRVIAFWWGLLLLLAVLSWVEPAWWMEIMQPGKSSEAMDFKHLGDVALEEGHLPRAIQAYELGLKRAPESVELRGNLGIALARAGRSVEARRTLEWLARENVSQNTIALYNLAELEEQASDFALAAQHYVTSAEGSPHPAPALARAGRMYMKLGLAEEAARMFESSLAADTCYHCLHDAMWLRLEESPNEKPAFEAGRYAKWVFDWLKGSERDLARSHYNLALCYHHLSLHELVEENCQRALSAWPDFREPGLLLAEVQRIGQRP
jgi:tetratricopeptide (TPR) repeat protein